MAKPIVNFVVNKVHLWNFKNTLRLYAKRRKLDNKDALNRAGMQLAYSAAYNTHRASAAEISAKLKQQVAPIRKTKSGKVSKDQAGTFAATTVGLVHMIIRMRQGRLYYRGFPNGTNPRQFSREELKKLALRYVNRRISSAAFIASGWKNAWAKFRAAYKGGAAGTSAKAFRGYPGKGGASVAVASNRSSVTLWNSSTTKDPTSGPALIKYGTPGLNKALVWVRQDMTKHLRRQLDKRSQQLTRGT